MSGLARLRLAVVALAASAVPVGASCVAPGGAGGCFATIQAAVDVAVPGEIIEVAAGTYPDAVVIPEGARLTLHGAGVGATVLDGGTLGNQSILVVRDNTRVAFQDMTVQHGTGYLGGAMETDGGRITIERCRFTANQSPYGGAIYAFGGGSR